MYNHSPDDYICPFCLISQGIEDDNVLTKQDDIVYRDNFITAFISAGCWKNNKGHIIIIPNQHYENIYDLPETLSTRIHNFEKEIALAFKEVYNCDGVSSRQHNEPCGNQDVWHYHLHVFPRYAGDDLYKSERELLSPEERHVFAEKLRSFLSNKNKPIKAIKISQLCGVSNLQIRECKIEDTNSICQLNCSEMGYKYPVDKTKNKLERLLKSDKDKIFVATVQNIVVGYIHANDYDVIYAPHMKNVMGIAVSSKYKKQGIGRAMLKEIEKWAQKTGASGIRLVSGSTRIEAHEFFRRCGYDGGKQQLNFKICLVSCNI